MQGEKKITPFPYYTKKLCWLSNRILICWVEGLRFKSTFSRPPPQMWKVVSGKVSYLKKMSQIIIKTTAMTTTDEGKNQSDCLYCYYVQI